MKLTSYLKVKILALLRNAFPNHEDILTDGLGVLIVYFIYFTVFVMVLPLLLTNPWFCLIDFSNTGQIGDTIGGVMGPIIALLAAFLTFLAFWIQYRANEKQNKIAKKQIELAEQQNEMVAKQTEIEQRQELKYAIERFENTLNQMLEVYSKNSESVKAGEFSGKEAFEEMAAELVLIYRVLNAKVIELSRTNAYKKIENDGLKEAVNLYLNMLNKDKSMRKNFLMDLSYALFFTGFYIKDKENLQSDPVRNALENELYWSIKNMIFEKDLSCTYKSKLKSIKRISTTTYRAPYPMAAGHDNSLGHYYRQMLQIVRFVSETPNKLIAEEQKYEYVKLLRSQMCNAEQVLFYYNSTSVWGKAWKERHGDNDDDISSWEYIIRYRLIKNIPSSFIFVGVPPKEYYKEEIQRWESKYHKNFFETDLFAINGSDV